MVTAASSWPAMRRVIGRGLLGKPRGKLVDLAVESGVLPATKPPMIPFVKHEIASGTHTVGPAE